MKNAFFLLLLCLSVFACKQETKAKVLAQAMQAVDKNFPGKAAAKSCTPPLHPLRSFGRVPKGPRRALAKNVILDVTSDLGRFQAHLLVARAGAA